MRRLVISLAALALLVVGVAGPAIAELVPEEERWFLRNDGADCGGASNPFLSTVPGSDELNCGYLGGLPFSEVFTATGDEDFGTKSYATADGVPVTIDATRDAQGVITIAHYVGIGGAGFVDIDLTLTGLEPGGFVQRNLGSTTVTEQLNPAAGEQEVEFSFDIDDGEDMVEFESLTLHVNVRGVHVLSGFTEVNGSSYVILPILVEDGT